MNIDDARAKMLEIIGHDSDDGFGRDYVVKTTADQLKIGGGSSHFRLVLQAWDDLYRQGIISYGMDRANAGQNWSHLTAHGRGVVAQPTRDPSNPAGYRSAVAGYVEAESVAASYLSEALETYNRGCVKAAAVMLGGAAEAMNLHVRDKLKEKMTSKSEAIPADLDDWRIAKVLRTMENVIRARTSAMPNELKERFGSYWPAWTGLFRMTRNEAGHPKSVEPVTRETVHAALLLFPEQARLCHDLHEWIGAAY